MNINNNKLVSVCMCTRNRAYRMLPAIKCILDQTYKNFEFIIIDDCSTDETETVVNQLQKQDNRIKYIKLNEHDFIYARNLAFLSATGEYIALIDSDDKCSPNKLEEQIKFLDEHPDIDVVGCKIQFGAKTSNLSIPKTFNTWKDEYFKNELENNNENISMLLHFPSIMIRKETIHRIFKNNMYFYPELKNGGEDQMFLYSLYINNAKFANISNATYLYNYLEYDDSISSSIGKHFNENNFIFKYIHNKPLSDRIEITRKLYMKYNG